MRTSITERRRSSKASRVPPTEPAKSVSPVKQTSSLTSKASIPRAVPGRAERLDAELAGLDHLAVADAARRLGRPRPASATTVVPEAPLELLVVRDVVRRARAS